MAAKPKIASKLGGKPATTGIVNRISRTEYEMLIKVVDAGTGARVAAGYAGLRMGSELFLAARRRKWADGTARHGRPVSWQ